MTYKPKELQDMYSQNTGKSPERVDNTGYFLEYGKMKDGTKRELSDTIKVNGKLFSTFDNNAEVSKKRSYIKEHIIKYGFGGKTHIGLINNLVLRIKEKIGGDLSDQNINNYIKYLDKKTEKDFESKINNIKIYCEELGVTLSEKQIKANIYIANRGMDKFVKRSAFSGYVDRSITFLRGSRNRYVFYHEFGHHICEQTIVTNQNKKSKNKHIYINGYTSNNRKNYINEGFTEIFAYGCLKKETNKNLNIDSKNGYTHIVKNIAKLIDLASKKLNKPQKYIYDYLMRGYLIKGYKGLNIFYQTFDKDKEIIKGLLNLGLDKDDEYKFMSGVKQKYKQLGFSTQEEAIAYFDTNNPPSQEIGDIMGIER